MILTERWQQAAYYFTPSPRQALIITILLLAVSAALFLYNDQLRQQENVQAAVVQANILAGTLAGPIAFDDATAIQEYLEALQANPAVIVASVYNVNNQLIAGFSRPGFALPSHSVMSAPRVVDRDILVTAQVTQRNIPLGLIYLDIAIEPLLQRVIHYLGMGLVIILACWLVVMLAAANAKMVEAHRQLQDEMKERKTIEEHLRHSQKMESLGELTGGVAHDFNNLLMVASSALELMERTTDQHKITQLKAALRQTIDRGAALTKQLLAFARRTPLTPQVLDLGDMLQSMRPLLERSLREDIHIELIAAPDLWLVEIDPSQFGLTILNLAINSRDAMPMGGTIRIILTNVISQKKEVMQEMVKIEFRDTGSGISPDVLSRVFEPFFTTKKVGRGTGLGLSQVYGYIHASGGEVDILSSPGLGTTVIILLPRSYKVLTLNETPSSLKSMPAIQQSWRILIVEDDLQIADLLGNMCSELGYQTHHVANAAQALELLQAQATSFDLVLSDMVMPGPMDGLELALEINKKYPTLPVLLTTGSSRAAGAAAQHGFRLLLKPYRLTTLAAELSTALSARK